MTITTVGYDLNPRTLLGLIMIHDDDDESDDGLDDEYEQCCGYSSSWIIYRRPNI